MNGLQYMRELEGGREEGGGSKSIMLISAARRQYGAAGLGKNAGHNNDQRRQRSCGKPSKRKSGMTGREH